MYCQQHQETRTIRIAQLVEADGVYLYSLTEFVGLTAHDDRNVVRIRHHCHHGCASSGHEMAVDQERVGTQEHFRHLGGGGWVVRWRTTVQARRVLTSFMA